MAHNYYQILQVNKSATTKEIKAAYRRLIFQYHPDRNLGSAASKMAALLNEAYDTLSNDRKRKLYDESLKMQSSADVKSDSGQASQSKSEPIPDYRCARCGRQDSSLRLTLMHYVVSLLLVTYRRGASGIWCSHCRAFEATKWTLLTGLMGWWGFPWGPIYSIGAIITNAKGGEQPVQNNAILLRHLAYKMYQDGNYKEAFYALQESLRLEANEDAAKLLEYLRTKQVAEKPYDYWGVASAIPSAIVALAMAGIIFRVFSTPSGYEATYKPPVTRNKAPYAKTTNNPEIGRSCVNAIANQLAEIVATRAPIVGTHYEGTTKVTDHVLDRSKFSAAELYQLADSINVELGKNVADYDGFIASAYFNAQLFALSVDVINSIENGVAIDKLSTDIINLGKMDYVQMWLKTSNYFSSYNDLCSRLKLYKKQYVPGKPTDELETEWKGLDSRCRNLKLRLEEYRSLEDIDGYNSLVASYNATARMTNRCAHQLRFRSTAQQKLDLAFNRCLDINILLTKFNKANLTSHAAEIDSAPEPDK
ncbi:MAG: hypothetical protein COW52_06160 [Nitrospirae bacterium CG17_big_fil_post_rev_8_21_14_2_50_50_9]|nr:MAG: hypothetical protein COW52_06160 [Nitrospirae bacterium CG17_big_fil_post_rev_8_21_14_2_50_50_9]PIW85767.1 MAG: hypothetical protein COZ95_02785 [Nitrospirae bacterium CG_4_8_14_3_um_filter_50_41]